MRTVRGTSLSSSARTDSWARPASTSWHSTRSRPMRTGPLRSTRTGRQMPPGFQSASSESECWNAPVTARFLVRSPGGAHVTSTASTCSEPRRASSVIS